MSIADHQTIHADMAVRALQTAADDVRRLPLCEIVARREWILSSLASLTDFLERSDRRAA